MNHQQVLQAINEHDFTATASELHGLITGLVAGGMFKGSNDYLEHMSEMYNNGLTIKGSLKKAADSMADSVYSQFEAEDMSFNPLLLDDDELLSDQAEELLNWVQGFLVGFGLNKRDLKTASNDVREVIDDFTNITKLDTEMEDSNENQADFYEIIEFIRVSAVLVHQEFGKHVNNPQNESKTLH